MHIWGSISISEEHVRWARQRTAAQTAQLCREMNDELRRKKAADDSAHAEQMRELDAMATRLKAHGRFKTNVQPTFSGAAAPSRRHETTTPARAAVAADMHSRAELAAHYGKFGRASCQP